MALTETMENLVKLMKPCGVTQDGGIVILCLISEHGIEKQMLAWMMEQKEAPTENELLVQLLKLSGLYFE